MYGFKSDYCESLQQIGKRGNIFKYYRNPKYNAWTKLILLILNVNGYSIFTHLFDLPDSGGYFFF